MKNIQNEKFANTVLRTYDLYKTYTDGYKNNEEDCYTKEFYMENSFNEWDKLNTLASVYSDKWEITGINAQVITDMVCDCAEYMAEKYPTRKEAIMEKYFHI